MQRLKAGKGWQIRRGPVQKKWVTGFVAVLFIGAGAALGNAGQHYGEQREEEAKTAVLAAIQKASALANAAADEIEAKEETAKAKEETETKAEEESREAPSAYKPAPDKLNLAYYYPEDAKLDEIIDSYAGEVFQELMVLDLDWLSDLYELSDISPSTMAARLGKGSKAVMGGYNPRDKTHRANNPSSWVIHDWKKIHVDFIDGDGRPIDAFSNVKDILSMASVYTYFTDMMDVDTFSSYSRQLWENSHSYSLSMGDLYYCSGCLNKTEEELVREAEEEEFAAEQMPFLPTAGIREGGVSGVVQSRALPSAGSISSPEGGAETSAGTLEAAESETASAESGAASLESEASSLALPTESGAAPAESAGETAAQAASILEESSVASGEAPGGSAVSAENPSLNSSVQESFSRENSTVNENTGNASSVFGNSDSGINAASAADGSSVSGNSAPGTMAGNTAAGSSVSGNSAPGTALGTIWGNASPSDLQNPSGNRAGEQEALQGKAGKKTQYDCPGHIDLYIRVKVLGLKDKKGLFSISKAAEKKKWDGWNTKNIASVNKISGQDWFEDYGLSISSITLSVPLTNQEIDDYMNRLPADTSVTRRNVIHFALSSVGRVPYYWGGKPSAPGYEGNDFGALTPADAKGRLLRGLDCSGWINWVYWSATGKRLAGESTSSLCLCGKQVDRSELKPGDIIVRTGAGAHVVMFLGWNADGRMNIIHETSGSINNVSVATISAPPWPYYRKLVE